MYRHGYTNIIDTCTQTSVIMDNYFAINYRNQIIHFVVFSVIKNIFPLSLPNIIIDLTYPMVFEKWYVPEYMACILLRWGCYFKLTIKCNTFWLKWKEDFIAWNLYKSLNISHMSRAKITNAPGMHILNDMTSTTLPNEGLSVRPHFTSKSIYDRFICHF